MTFIGKVLAALWLVGHIVSEKLIEQQRNLKNVIFFRCFTPHVIRPSLREAPLLITYEKEDYRSLQMITI